MDAFGYEIFVALVAGAGALLLLYIIRSLVAGNDDEATGESKQFFGDNKKRDCKIQQKSNKSSKKKTAESGGKWKKEEKFTHPWLITTLKGHTGKILDLDYSSNEKYLATCADDPDPGGSNLENENVTVQKENLASGVNKGLSRRQRKNRRRDSSPNSDVNNNNSPNKKPLTMRLNISERKLSTMLNSYVLSYEEMCSFGYPVESHLHPGRAVIFKNNSYDSNLDANAQVFVPKSCSSGSSDDSAENESDENTSDDMRTLKASNFPNFQKQPLKDSSNINRWHCNDLNQLDQTYADGIERTCCRCSSNFLIGKNNEYLTRDSCVYHWGKLRRKGHLLLYTCCNGSKGNKGCATAKLHVWGGLVDGINGPFESYVKTKFRKNATHHSVYALDCEMCFTASGLELTKVTVVAPDGRLVYNSFVRPDSEIVDYNTRFSGISAKDLTRKNTKSLKEVQNDLMGFINAQTILVGHALENDLRALKIMHYKCVDTSAAFPHYNGWPFRRSLKMLALHVLKRDIQHHAKGHDSYEDAATAMEIMIWRVRKDFRSLSRNDLIVC